MMETNIVLFQAHAHAEMGEGEQAREFFREAAEVVDLETFRRKRLAAALGERYGLGEGEPASGERAAHLDAEILERETDLLNPTRLAA